MHAKFPETPWLFWLSMLALAIVLVGLCRLTRWSYIIAVPVAALAIYNGWGTLYRNVDFRDTIIHEFGSGYFWQYAFSFAVPIIGLAVYGIYDFRHRQRRLAEPIGRVEPPSSVPIKATPHED